MPHPICTHEGCDSPVLNRLTGLCQRHYFQHRMANQKTCMGCNRLRLCGEDGRCRACAVAAQKVCPDCGGQKKKVSALCKPCFDKARVETDIQGILRALANGAGGSATARRFNVSPAYVSALRQKYTDEIVRLARQSKRTRIVDLAGRTFGRLTVLGESDRRSSGGHILWQCRCECGGTTEVVGTNLTGGNTRTCGCGQGRSSDGK